MLSSHKQLTLGPVGRHGYCRSYRVASGCDQRLYNGERPWQLMSSTTGLVTPHQRQRHSMRIWPIVFSKISHRRSCTLLITFYSAKISRPRNTRLSIAKILSRWSAYQGESTQAEGKSNTTSKSMVHQWHYMRKLGPRRFTSCEGTSTLPLPAFSYSPNPSGGFERVWTWNRSDVHHSMLFPFANVLRKVKPLNHQWVPHLQTEFVPV